MKWSSYLTYLINWFFSFKFFSFIFPERLTHLSLEERRKGYFCPNNYKELSTIQTWRQYFEENEKTLSEKGKT